MHNEELARKIAKAIADYAVSMNCDVIVFEHLDIGGKEAELPNNKLCKFSNGKIYNCDLSASYNIGARYFIREMEKNISAKRWSQIQAKVSDCEKRTRCTYATLLMINKAT